MSSDEAIYNYSSIDKDWMFYLRDWFNLAFITSCIESVTLGFGTCGGLGRVVLGGGGTFGGPLAPVGGALGGPLEAIALGGPLGADGGPRPCGVGTVADLSDSPNGVVSPSSRCTSLFGRSVFIIVCFFLFSSLDSRLDKAE